MLARPRIQVTISGSCVEICAGVADGSSEQPKLSRTLGIHFEDVDITMKSRGNAVTATVKVLDIIEPSSARRGGSMHVLLIDLENSVISCVDMPLRED